MSQLQDVAWDAAESIDYDDIELESDPFKPIKKVLDVLFQHEEEVELPERCQGFFEQFSRDKGEELQAYLVRHQTLLKKLKDLKVEIPPLLAGWHMLTRTGLPRWTHPAGQSTLRRGSQCSERGQGNDPDVWRRQQAKRQGHRLSQLARSCTTWTRMSTSTTSLRRRRSTTTTSLRSGQRKRWMR